MSRSLQNVFLRAEILIDEGFRDPKRSRDLVERRLSITLCIEEVDRCRDNSVPLELGDEVLDALGGLGATADPLPGLAGGSGL